VVETFQTSASAREYRRTSTADQIHPSNSQNVIIPLAGYEPIRVLAQENHRATLKIAKELQIPGKKPPILWILEAGFITNLQWDLGDWHWQEAHNMGDAPFFGYSAKRGYRNAKQALHTPSISSFIQRLNLCNSTVAQVIARLWHNARPRKVGALTWLTLNNGLPVGTWLQKMGIPAPCKGCHQGCPESTQHCLMDCSLAQLKRVFLQAWEATAEVGMASWKAIRSTSHQREHSTQTSIEKAIKAEWFMDTFLGRMRLPLRGTSSPPCTFSIFLMTDGDVASFPVKGSLLCLSTWPTSKWHFVPRLPKFQKLGLSQAS